MSARRSAVRTISVVWLTMIEEYCRHLAAMGKSPGTVQLRREALRRIARELGRDPGVVSEDDLTNWFAAQRWKPETRRSYRSTVKGFFGWAYRQGKVSQYLGDAVSSVPIPPSTPRPVTDQAWRDALAKATPREIVMLRLAAEAGLRRAEVARVRSADVIEGYGGPQLVVEGKGGRVRVLPISDSLAALVRAGSIGHTPALAAVGDNGYLFPGEHGGHLAPKTIGAAISALLPPNYSMHKLRTRFASRAFRGSRNLRAVQTLLGHSSLAVTERYVAVDDDEVRAAMMSAALTD